MTAFLPVALLLTALIPAGIIFFLPDDRERLRSFINLAGAVLKLALVGYMILSVEAGDVYETRFALVPGLDLLLRVDALALLFITLSAFLWLLTTIYAIAYFKGAANLSRFFGFFSLCVAATVGIALSGTLITFFVFYELLTLATWPLVVHKGNTASLEAGRRYLAYTLSGSAVFLAGIVLLTAAVGPITFVAPPDFAEVDPWLARTAFVLVVGGLAVKAAMVPLHGWLPVAMAAPAPVSALLHAVAVVKAGAFGIVRVIYDVYGTDFVQALGLGLPLAALAAVTILYGSLLALRQTDIKRRLAYSTVSQVSYIVLGASLAGPFATIGGLVHLVHQGIMKITLFFCAGLLDEKLKITRIDQLDGVGRRLPLTMLAFSIGALGMIGVPPTAGFISKWYLGLGGLQAGQGWVVLVLVGSSLLNAAYFLPLLYRAWFKPMPDGVDESDSDAARALERPWGFIGPPLVTAAASLLVGLLAASPLSPLGWATLIVERAYLP